MRRWAGDLSPPRRLLVALSLVLALAASLVLLFAPTYEVHAGDESPALGDPGPGSAKAPLVHSKDPPVIGRVTLVEQEGLLVLPLLVAPVAVAAIVLALQSTRFGRASAVVGSALLSAGAFVALFSIGVFYLPSAIAMVVAAFLRR